MPDCPTPPWSPPAWVRPPPSDSPGPVQMLYSATVTIAAGSAIDTAKNLESLRTHPPDPAAKPAIFGDLQSQPGQDRRDAPDGAAATAGRFPQGWPSPWHRPRESNWEPSGPISDSPGAGGAVYAYVCVAAQRNGDFSQILRVYDPLTGVPFPHALELCSHVLHQRRLRHCSRSESRGARPCYDRYLSGLGLRATDGCKPRQVRKEATVVVRFVCRGLPGAWHNCPRGIRIPTPCTR